MELDWSVFAIGVTLSFMVASMTNQSVKINKAICLVYRFVSSNSHEDDSHTSEAAMIPSESVGRITMFASKKNHTYFECVLDMKDENFDGEKGVHIHCSGDLTRGCTSTCTHYNPTGGHHGGRDGMRRHKGDLGNLLFVKGKCNANFKADVTLDDVIGRAIVIHEKEDDLGKGTGADEEESQKTGNAGVRVACGIIAMT